MNKVSIVILAGGLGKRMQTEIPKVLSKLHGKPMISYVLEAIESSGVCDNPVIVVGKKREMVIEKLGSKYRYAIQEEQLGTGHAVVCAEDILNISNLPVVVLYGDMPNISSETIKSLTDKHFYDNSIVTMATAKLPDFEEWRAGFYDFSRIIRDENGDIIRTVEKKDATEDELKITEINPCYFCFDSKWLWSNLKKINNLNAQGEYYLTDLIKLATEEDIKISSVSIDPKEAIGVNTKEHLEELHKLLHLL